MTTLRLGDDLSNVNFNQTVKVFMLKTKINQKWIYPKSTSSIPDANASVTLLLPKTCNTWWKLLDTTLKTQFTDLSNYISFIKDDHIRVKIPKWHTFNNLGYYSGDETSERHHSIYDDTGSNYIPIQDLIVGDTVKLIFLIKKYQINDTTYGHTAMLDSLHIIGSSPMSTHSTDSEPPEKMNVTSLFKD